MGSCQPDLNLIDSVRLQIFLPHFPRGNLTSIPIAPCFERLTELIEFGKPKRAYFAARFCKISFNDSPRFFRGFVDERHIAALDKFPAAAEITIRELVPVFRKWKVERQRCRWCRRPTGTCRYANGGHQDFRWTAPTLQSRPCSSRIAMPAYRPL